MRIATFNISAGRSLVDGRVDVARFADAIAALDADVLALQEVDRDQARSGGADLTQVAADAMRAVDHVFAPALYGTPGRSWTAATDEARDGPAYGCALLCRYPLHDVEVLRMRALPVVLPLWVPGVGVVPVREEPRVAIIVHVPALAATVIGTHLAFTPAWKRRQLRRIVRALATRADPLLLLGDLNMRGGAAVRSTGFRSLADLPTYPATRPRVQLDHVLVRDPSTRFVTVTVSTPSLPVSDHRPVVVELDDARAADR